MHHVSLKSGGGLTPHYCSPLSASRPWADPRLHHFMIQFLHWRLYSDDNYSPGAGGVWSRSTARCTLHHHRRASVILPAFNTAFIQQFLCCSLLWILFIFFLTVVGFLLCLVCGRQNVWFVNFMKSVQSWFFIIIFYTQIAIDFDYGSVTVKKARLCCPTASYIAATLKTRLILLFSGLADSWVTLTVGRDLGTHQPVTPRNSSYRELLCWVFYIHFIVYLLSMVHRAQ